MATLPNIAARGSEGLSLQSGANGFAPLSGFEIVPACRTAQFSGDGAYIAYATSSQVQVVRTQTLEVAVTLDHANVIKVFFSPLASTVATFSRYQTDKNHQGSDNVCVWRLDNGDKVYSAIARGDDWAPQWSSDEKLFARLVSNEVQFFDGTDFAKGIQRKLYLKDITKYAISPGPVPNIAAFVPSKKGAPAFVRIFKPTDLETPIANKSFFKADSVDLTWNSTGTHLLVHTHVAVDAQNKSYYGENHLYYMSAKGDYDSIVQLDKEGPIYSVEWSPDGTEFIVVYGFMPAKAMLLGPNCTPLMNFGTGPRNAVKFNPQGNIICLAGFGNLRGEMEFWDRKRLRLVNKFSAPDTTFWDWAPDGEHLVTATLSPRLRVGNGYKVWHYDGRLLHNAEYTELVQVTWQPAAAGVYEAKPAIPIQAAVRAAKADDASAAKPAVYRPPGARGQAASFSLRGDAEEKPQKLTGPQQKSAPAVKMPPGAEAAGLSKSALKNKKKREAKKKSAENDEAEADAPSEAAQQSTAVANGDSEDLSVEELIKKLRNLGKKLRQIEDLKKKQSEGTALEANQLEKLQGEAALRAEIAALEARQAQ